MKSGVGASTSQPSDIPDALGSALPLIANYRFTALPAKAGFKKKKKKNPSVKDAEEAGEAGKKKKQRAVPTCAASALKLMMETILSASADYWRVWAEPKLLLLLLLLR